MDWCFSVVGTDSKTHLKRFDQKHEDVYNYRNSLPREIKKQNSRLLHVIIY